MGLRRCAGITACAGRAGRPPLAKFRRPEEVRREPASGRLDDLAPNPAGWTTSTPMTRPLAGLRRRDRGNPCIDRGPKFGALVRIEAAQIVGESLHQPIGRQGSSPFGIVLTDDRERRRVVLRAGYLFGPVDRGLDRFDSATRNPAVLARPARRSTYWRRVGQGTQRRSRPGSSGAASAVSPAERKRRRAVTARGCLYRRGQRFESPQLHQEVRTSAGGFPAPKIIRRYIDAIG
jgi:hypothetical protein